MQAEPLPNTRAAWPSWAESLRRRGLENLAAWALEAAGPLTVLGAQALYIGEPLLRSFYSGTRLGSLAGLLEDDREVEAFAAFLREEGTK